MYIKYRKIIINTDNVSSLKIEITDSGNHELKLIKFYEFDKFTIFNFKDENTASIIFHRIWNYLSLKKDILDCDSLVDENGSILQNK